MADYVIDASSVLTFAFGEPGADIVADTAADESNRILISAINLAEVFAKLADHGIATADANRIVRPLTMDEVPFDSAQARISAELRPATKRYGLSLGDRCCLALAISRAAFVLTAERSWPDAVADLGIKVVVTRPEAPRRH